MRRFIPRDWISSKWLIGTLAAALGFLASSGLDQVVRNRVDEHMHGYFLRELLPIGNEDYQALPIHWRQVISELSVRLKLLGDSESKILIATLEHFDVNQLRLVDKIAPYMMFDFLVRDPSRMDTQHPIPDIVYADFLDLESLGVLQSVARGTIIRREVSNGEYVIHTGTHTVTIGPGQESRTLRLPTTRISPPWTKLIALLRVPTDLHYIEWFASNMRKAGFRVKIDRKDQSTFQRPVKNK